MNLLLDTSTFLWITLGSPHLSRRARQLFLDPANDVYLSTVSAWEVAVKHPLGRLPLPEAPDRFIPAQREAHGIESLSLIEEAALHVVRLPHLHNDPFDRMLVCQAIIQGMLIVTSDPLVTQYPIRTVW